VFSIEHASFSLGATRERRAKTAHHRARPRRAPYPKTVHVRVTRFGEGAFFQPTSSARARERALTTHSLVSMM
jgi:hypothetical protein